MELKYVLVEVAELELVLLIVLNGIEIADSAAFFSL